MPLNFNSYLPQVPDYNPSDPNADLVKRYKAALESISKQQNAGVAVAPPAPANPAVSATAQNNWTSGLETGGGYDPNYDPTKQSIGAIAPKRSGGALGAVARAGEQFKSGNYQQGITGFLGDAMPGLAGIFKLFGL